MNETDDRHETEDERDDRNLMELLQELRVARPRGAGAVRLSALLAIHVRGRAGLITCLFTVLWFALPLARRQRAGQAG